MRLENVWIILSDKFRPFTIETPYLDHSTCTNLASISFSGNGKINTFNSDIYLQNETITIDNYYAGQNIFVGENVTTNKTPGPVNFTNNCKIVLGADQEITFDKGTQINAGCSFETKLF